MLQCSCLRLFRLAWCGALAEADQPLGTRGPGGTNLRGTAAPFTPRAHVVRDTHNPLWAFTTRMLLTFLSVTDYSPGAEYFQKVLCKEKKTRTRGCSVQFHVALCYVCHFITFQSMTAVVISVCNFY